MIDKADPSGVNFAYTEIGEKSIEPVVKTLKLSKNAANFDDATCDHGVDSTCSHETPTGFPNVAKFRNVKGAEGAYCPSCCVRCTAKD